MIIINPEFHRHVWLNFSPFRLIVMPALLALILYVFSSQNVEFWQVSVFLPALYTYFLAIFVWGNYEAATASNKDMGQNTWDFQKMSSLTPWELVIGKLFGATSYAWYAGLMLLCVVAFSYDFLDKTEEFKHVHAAYPTPIKPIIYLIVAGVMGHAAAFLAGTHGLRQKKSGAAAPFIIGLVVSSTVLSLTIGTDLKELSIKDGTTVNWHFFEIGEHAFLIGSLLFFFFWTIMAIQRNLREELQYKNSPIVLMLFLITVSLYFTGYLNNVHNFEKLSLGKAITAKTFFAFFIIAIFTYLTVFMDASNLAKYKRWVYAIKTREWKRVFENTPAWVGCATLLIPAYVIANFGMADTMTELDRSLQDKFSIFAFTTAIILFTARDGFIYHSILLGKIERHKAFLLLLYLFMVYGLLPFLAVTVVKNMTAAGGDLEQNFFDTLLAFYPIGGSSVVLGCVPVLIQSIVAFLVLRYVVKSLKA